MKRLLLSSAIAMAIVAPASAADLATRYPVKAPVVAVAPVFSWTGFYIGANAGFGGGDKNYTFSDLSTSSSNASGFIAGGQIGYNFQFANNVVLGLETDIQWSGIESDVTSASAGSVTSLNNSLDYYGTVRARLGYAFDRVLPYVTGGFAYGKTKTEAAALDATGLSYLDGSETKTGWTVGGGIEYALTNNWTIKTEYNYVDLGDSDFGNILTGGGTVDNKFHTVRAGVNYKF
ncbi:membrane protein [Azorhizobium oxalatiphilum]|uniref:Membrane protein n=1 Tax=Azorhizobium oxalatiphilum TaxID=980631 RepID=A0A917F6Y1_9HYPH|nr:outer membrane protein [Azorhizobium oxalatiphilum]GGF52275.1 membrane protein [Azorhizobium oxalatiphilum]